MSIKPISPEQWDAATPRERRYGIVPAVRPTQEQYDAQMLEWSAKEAASQARRDLTAKLEAAGGSFWMTEQGTNRRVYFNDYSEAGMSGYVDLETGAYVSDKSGFEAAIRAKAGL